MRRTCFSTALPALARLYEFLIALSSKLVAAWADRALRARMSRASAPHSPFSKGIFPDVDAIAVNMPIHCARVAIRESDIVVANGNGAWFLREFLSRIQTVEGMEALAGSSIFENYVSIVMSFVIQQSTGSTIIAS